jgi:hypothetical protein
MMRVSPSYAGTLARPKVIDMRKSSASRRGALDNETLGRLDALAKMLVVGFPIVAVVTYHSRRDRLMVDIWSQIDPHGPRTPQMRSCSVALDECPDPDAYVRQVIGDFLTDTGPWYYQR